MDSHRGLLEVSSNEKKIKKSNPYADQESDITVELNEERGIAMAPSFVNMSLMDVQKTSINDSKMFSNISASVARTISRRLRRESFVAKFIAKELKK